jgi:hypothetical protein
MRDAIDLGLGLSLALWATADAATVHRAKPPEGQLRTQQPVTVRPSEGATATPGFAVPGWTDEATRRWMDNATSAVGLGGGNRRRSGRRTSEPRLPNRPDALAGDLQDPFFQSDVGRYWRPCDHATRRAAHACRRRASSPVRARREIDLYLHRRRRSAELARATAMQLADQDQPLYQAVLSGLLKLLQWDSVARL